jgi:AAA domain
MDTSNNQNCVKFSNCHQNDSFTHILDLENKLIKKNLISIIGRRKTGKTTLCKKISQKLILMYDIKNITVFTHNKNEYLEYENVMSNYQSSYIKKIMDNIKLEPIVDNTKLEPILIIFDDCFYSKKINEDESFINMMLNGRHYNIFIINVCQQCLFKPIIRTNTDLIFVSKEEIIGNIKRLYEQYFGTLKFKQFNDTILSLNYFQWLVMDNTNVHLDDNIHYYG